MKGYGLPRNDDVSSPDKLDLINYARASHVGRFSGKSGDYKNSFRNVTAKKQTRRIFKRLARRANASAIKEQVE